MIEMLERIQKLEKQKNTIFGILIIILGIACLCLSERISGSIVKDFISGTLVGLAVGEMIIGTYVSASNITKHKRAFIEANDRADCLFLCSIQAYHKKIFSIFSCIYHNLYLIVTILQKSAFFQNLLFYHKMKLSKRVCTQ